MNPLSKLCPIGSDAPKYPSRSWLRQCAILSTMSLQFYLGTNFQGCTDLRPHRILQQPSHHQKPLYYGLQFHQLPLLQQSAQPLRRHQVAHIHLNLCQLWITPMALTGGPIEQTLVATETEYHGQWPLRFSTPFICQMSALCTWAIIWAKARLRVPSFSLSWFANYSPPFFFFPQDWQSSTRRQLTQERDWESELLFFLRRAYQVQGKGV